VPWIRDARLRRRELLAAGGALVLGAVLGDRDGFPRLLATAPAFVRDRPLVTHGVQTGDPTHEGGVVWARADRPSRMWVELGADTRVPGPVVGPAGDHTGKVVLRGLPSGTEVPFRVVFEALHAPGAVSEPVAGSLRTAPADERGVSFLWSGDLAGQGWGINPDAGGFRIFRAMAAVGGDFFLCSGDTVYADIPLAPAVTLPDGRTWTNLVTPAKAKVAETLDEYRGQYAYNLQDAALQAFAARVPQVNQWDDHEVANGWYTGEVLEDPRRTEQRVDVLAERARQAFFEWLPTHPHARRWRTVHRKISHGPLLDVFVVDMRTYRDPNGGDRYADPRRGLLGPAQRAWLERELAASTATWKVLANDLPIGLVVPDGPGPDAVAQGIGGRPLGRELEFAEILRRAHRDGVTGIVMLTADVHYAAAHHYDPARGSAGEFTPFWEFVSGPLNAGPGQPRALDPTFGPEVVFQSAAPPPGACPLDGYQYFGEVAIDGSTRVMTVRLRDIDGAVLYSVDLPPGG